MLITERFLDTVGQRSPMARKAMVQAGDKIRIRAMKQALISIGACEITYEDISRLGLDVLEKRFSFTLKPLVFVFLDEKTFNAYKPITNPVELEVSLYRNGVIGLRRKHDA